MKSRKMLAKLIMLGVIAGVVGGCGNSKVANVSTPKESQVASAGSSETPKTEERPTVSIMLVDYEGSPLSGNYSQEVLDKMEEYTNTKVEFNFIANDSYDDKLSLTLASPQDMPMIISIPKMTGVITSATEAGAFWDLSEYIKDSTKYPNLSQANEQVNTSLTINGKLIGIYKARAIGRYGIGYRADWAGKLGIGEPKTIEDMYNMFYQFTYGDPDGNGKDDTYGVALCKYTGPFDIMQTWFGVGNGWVEENGQLVPVHQTKEYKEALDWFRKMYEDGLVYKDWAVRDTPTWTDAVKNGECGVFVDVLDNSRRIWDYFETEKIPSVTDANKNAAMNLIGTINDKTLATTGYNGFFVITKAADTPEKLEACLNYLDKMCDDEMLTLSSYGIEGVHWKLDANGFLLDLDAQDKVASKAYQALNQAVAYIPNLKATKPAVEMNERNQREEEVKLNNEKYAIFNPANSYLVNSATYALSGSTLDKLIDDTRTQYICGQINEDELSAQWDLWLKQGGQSIIDEVNEQYKANK